MSLAEILEQVKALSQQERDILLDELVQMKPQTEDRDASRQPKTGLEISAMLDAMDPIEFVDPHIEDPVEWVKAQRQKRQDKLKAFWDGDND